MSELVNALMNPGSMSQSQWLVLAIAGFIILGSFYFVWKLLKLVKNVGKTTYKPNIGLSRSGYTPPSKMMKEAEAEAEAEAKKTKAE